MTKTKWALLMVLSQNKDPQFHSWMRKNITMSSWLLNYISKEISMSVMYIVDVAAIWKVLHDCFQRK